MNMKTNNQIVVACKNKTVRARLRITLLGFLALARAVEAQDMFMPHAEFSMTPPALQSQTNEMDVFSPAETTAGFQPEKPPFQWGPVSLRPHPFYRFLYGDGIPSAQTNYVATTIQEISPGFLFGIGSHWLLDYRPTWRLYSNRQFRDSLDQSVRLTGGTTYEDWLLGLSQSYDSSSMPLVETGTQTEQETYATAINASYRMNSQMSLDLALNQKFTSAQQFQSSREWSTLDWLNYQFWPRLDAALGVGVGYVDVDTGPDMTYEQFQGRISWRATDKLSFQVHGGLEDRQFLISGTDDAINPVAGGAIQYQPFETTKLSLSADHAVGVSLLSASGSQNQVTESTDIRGSLNQRLLKQLHLDLGGGFHKVAYVSSGAHSASREDEFFSFYVRLSCLFLKRGTAAVFYQVTDNSSTQPGFTFSSSQVGFEVGYRY